MLADLAPGPVVTLNHAVAVADGRRPDGRPGDGRAAAGRPGAAAHTTGCTPSAPTCSSGPVAPTRPARRTRRRPARHQHPRAALPPGARLGIVRDEKVPDRVNSGHFRRGLSRQHAGTGPGGTDAGGDHEGDADDREHVGHLVPAATRPISRAKAGSRLIRVPNAAVVSRRSASSSRVNGTTGSRIARPRPTSSELRGQPAERARPGHDGGDQRGDRHRDGQRLEPRDLVADVLGEQDVRRPADRRGQREADAEQVRLARPRLGQQQHADGGEQPARAWSAPCPRATATPSGPRNSSALAVPSGSRATAAMNSRVTPPVTTPSTHAGGSAPAREVASAAAGRGPAGSRRPTPAAARRRPRRRCRRSGPPTTASPSWTQSIERDRHRRADAGAERRVGGGGRGASWRSCRPDHETVRVHVTLLDIPFMNPERWRMDVRRLPPARRAVPARLDARGRRGTGLTTSTVSQQIAALAREAGTALVEPVGRRVRLTPAGRSGSPTTPSRSWPRSRRPGSTSTPTPSPPASVAGRRASPPRSAARCCPSVRDLADRAPRRAGA